MTPLAIREAASDDAEAIAAIYNAGIAERVATFETREFTADDVQGGFEPGRDLLLVAELDARVVGWAGVSPYSDRHYYSGVGECALYVDPKARRSGIAAALLESLAEAASARGYHKLTGKVFAENQASLRLLERCDFRQVGVHRRHGQIDGGWKDVLVVERLLQRPDASCGEAMIRP